MFSDYRQTCRAVFIPFTSVAKFPLIWIRLKSHPSFSSSACQSQLQTCASFPSSASLLLMEVLSHPACHTMPGIFPPHKVRKTSLNKEWETPARRGWMCGVWLTVSPQSLQIPASACTLSMLTEGTLQRDLWTALPCPGCVLSLLKCPRLQICYWHHHKNHVRSLLPCLTFSIKGQSNYFDKM